MESLTSGTVDGALKGIIIERDGGGGSSECYNVKVVGGIRREFLS